MPSYVTWIFPSVRVIEPTFESSIAGGILMSFTDGTVYGGQFTAQSPAQFDVPFVSFVVAYTVIPLYALRYCPNVVSELTPRIRFSPTLVPSPIGATSPGHNANSQFGPVRPTDEPSGHILASCVHCCPPTFAPDHQYQPPRSTTRTTTIPVNVVVFINSYLYVLRL